MFKACQYVTNDNKIVVGLKNVSVKNAIKNYTLAFYFMIFQKIKEGKARMREGMCWKWDVTLEIENSNENKNFQQNVNV